MEVLLFVLQKTEPNKTIKNNMLDKSNKHDQRKHERLAPPRKACRAVGGRRVPAPVPVWDAPFDVIEEVLPLEDGEGDEQDDGDGDGGVLVVPPHRDPVLQTSGWIVAADSDDDVLCAAPLSGNVYGTPRIVEASSHGPFDLPPPRAPVSHARPSGPHRAWRQSFPQMVYSMSEEGRQKTYLRLSVTAGKAWCDMRGVCGLHGCTFSRSCRSARPVGLIWAWLAEASNCISRDAHVAFRPSLALRRSRRAEFELLDGSSEWLRAEAGGEGLGEPEFIDS